MSLLQKFFFSGTTETSTTATTTTERTQTTAATTEGTQTTSIARATTEGTTATTAEKAVAWDRACTKAGHDVEIETRMLGPWASVFRTTWQTEDTTVDLVWDKVHPRGLRTRRTFPFYFHPPEIVHKNKMYKRDFPIPGVHGASGDIKIRAAVAAERQQRKAPVSCVFERYKIVHKRRIANNVQLELSFVATTPEGQQLLQDLFQDVAHNDLGNMFAEHGTVPEGVQVEFEAEYIGRRTDHDLENELVATLWSYLVPQ